MKIESSLCYLTKIEKTQQASTCLLAYRSAYIAISYSIERLPNQAGRLSDQSLLRDRTIPDRKLYKSVLFQNRTSFK